MRQRALRRQWFVLFGLLAVAISAGSAGEVALEVAEHAGVARDGWPMTGGVPFARGDVVDPAAVAPPPAPEYANIPEKYRSPTTSDQTFEVKEGENTFDLDMTD